MIHLHLQESDQLVHSLLPYMIKNKISQMECKIANSFTINCHILKNTQTNNPLAFVQKIHYHILIHRYPLTGKTIAILQEKYIYICCMYVGLTDIVIHRREFLFINNIINLNIKFYEP